MTWGDGLLIIAAILALWRIGGALESIGSRLQNLCDVLGQDE